MGIKYRNVPCASTWDGYCDTHHICHSIISLGFSIAVSFIGSKEDFCDCWIKHALSGWYLTCMPLAKGERREESCILIAIRHWRWVGWGGRRWRLRNMRQMGLTKFWILKRKWRTEHYRRWINPKVRPRLGREDLFLVEHLKISARSPLHYRTKQWRSIARGRSLRRQASWSQKVGTETLLLVFALHNGLCAG